MYKKHQPMISSYARANASNMKQVLGFVLLTIRMPLDRAVADIDSLPYPDKSTLWGFKWDAWHNINKTYKEIYENLETYYEAYDSDTASNHMLAYLSSLKGFGLVKAGFALQLIYGLSGCIDTHNLRIHGVSINQVRVGKNIKPNSRLKRAIEYNKLVAKLGGTEFLWNNWCNYVAQQQPNKYTNGYEVSKLHTEVIT